MLKEKLSELLEKHECEIGQSRNEYLWILESAAGENHYKYDAGRYIEWFGLDSTYNYSLNKIKIPVKRRFSFLPDGELKIHFSIPFSHAFCEDRIQVPYFVDEEDALSKLNDFLQKVTDYYKKTIKFKIPKSQSEPANCNNSLLTLNLKNEKV